MSGWRSTLISRFSTRRSARRVLKVGRTDITHTRITPSWSRRLVCRQTRRLNGGSSPARPRRSLCLNFLSRGACLKSSGVASGQTVWYDSDARLRAGQHHRQDLDPQLAALDAAGVDPSRCSPTNSPGQPRRPGRDWSRWTMPARRHRRRCRDRPARPIRRRGRPHHRRLGEQRITLHVLREGVDTATPTGRAIRPSWPASQYWSSNWPRAPRRIQVPSRPASAGHQTPEAQPRTARTVFETLVRDFSATAIELHGKAS